MFGADDVDVARAVIADIIADNATTITLRRGNTTVSSQEFRVERRGGTALVVDSEYAEHIKGDLILIGSHDADVQADDRFNLDSGEYCKVIYVRPNRQVATQAEAVVLN